MAIIPLAAVTAFVPAKSRPMVARALSQLANEGGDVDTATVARILAKANPSDTSRRPLEQLLGIMRSYDGAAGVVAKQPDAVELRPMESVLLGRAAARAQQGAVGRRDVGSRFLAAWEPEEAPPAADAQTDPLDAELASLAGPPAPLMSLLARAADRRQCDKMWASQPASQDLAALLAEHSLPLVTSVYELSLEPGVVVFDKPTSTLLECVELNSLRGQRPLLLVNTGAELSAEAALELKDSGASEVVSLASLGADPVSAIGQRVTAWSQDQHRLIESAVAASGWSAESTPFLEMMDRLALLVRAGKPALLCGTDGKGVEAFVAKISTQPPNVYEPAQPGSLAGMLGQEPQIAALLGPDKPPLVVHQVERLQAWEQELLVAALTGPQDGARQAILCTTPTNLDSWQWLGLFDPKLAALLVRGQETMPVPSDDVGEMARIAASLFVQAGGDPAAPTDAWDAHFQVRGASSFDELRRIGEAVAKGHDPTGALTADVLAHLDAAGMSRARAVDAALDATGIDAGRPFRAAFASVLASLDEPFFSVVKLPGAEDLEVFVRLIESVASAGGALAGLDCIDVDALQSLDDVGLSPALKARLSAPGTPLMVVVGFENLLEAAQQELEAEMTVRVNAGTLRGGLLATAADVRELARDPTQVVFGLSLASGLRHVMPPLDDGQRFGRAAAVDDRQAQRAQAAVAARADAGRAQDDATRARIAKIERLAEKGQAFDELLQGIAPNVAADMMARMHNVRFEKWPAELRARAARGETIEPMVTEYVDAAKSLEREPDESLLRDAPATMQQARLTLWPEKIRATAADDLFFDDLLAEYRDAAVAVGGAVDEMLLQSLAPRIKEHLGWRADAGEDITVYWQEHERIARAAGQPVSAIQRVQLTRRMNEARVRLWPDQLRIAAEAGRDYSTLWAQFAQANQALGLVPDAKVLAAAERAAAKRTKDTSQ